MECDKRWRADRNCSVSLKMLHSKDGRVDVQMASFTEIVAVGNAARLLTVQQVVNILHLQIATEKEPDYGPLDNLLDDEERKNCECAVFFRHWVGGDLDAIRDIYTGVLNIDRRRLVAKAYGFQALRDLGSFIEIIQSGKEWEEIMSDDQISIQHNRWICCQVGIFLFFSGT
jgi:hypothetical protein